MFISLVLFGIVSGAPTAWMLRDDARWPRVALTALLGIATGIFAGFVVGTLLAGGKPAFSDPTWGLILGPLGAVIAARSPIRHAACAERFAQLTA
jgi:hypothetical protein